MPWIIYFLFLITRQPASAAAEMSIPPAAAPVAGLAVEEAEFPFEEELPFEELEAD